MRKSADGHTRFDTFAKAIALLLAILAFFGVSTITDCSGSRPMPTPSPTPTFSPTPIGLTITVLPPITLTPTITQSATVTPTKGDILARQCESARLSMVNGQPESALEICNDAIDEDVHNALAYLNRGIVYLRVETLAARRQGETDLSLAIDLGTLSEDNLHMARANRCLARYYLGQYSEALSDCQQALELDNNGSASNFLYLGLVYEKMGEIEAAIAWYGSYLDSTQISRGNRRIYSIRRAGLLEKMGQYEEAVANYSAALEIAAYSETYLLRGNAYYALGSSTEGTDEHLRLAINDFDMVQSIDPDNTAHYLGRGLAYCSLREKDNALNNLWAAVNIPSDDPNIADEANNIIQEINAGEQTCID